MSYSLNIATSLFDECRPHGVMICGINWGGNAITDSPPDHVSFFSDSATNRFPYRDRIVKWFRLFGHSLETQAGAEGGFERSIVQTNWLNTQSPHMRGRLLRSELVDGWQNMAWHLAELRPRLIFFMSVSLLETLNLPDIHDGAQVLLGNSGPPQYLRKDIVTGGRKMKRFRVGIQKFEEATIIALPHPTGSIGLSDSYIEGFLPVIEPLIREYKAIRGFQTAPE